MLRLMKEKESLNIVADQKGRPTYARDLAKATMQMVQLLDAGQPIKGIFHYANQGETTWFDFAAKIKAIAGLSCTLHPIDSAAFPTPAKRPKYSVLSTQKIESLLTAPIPNWEDALQACIKALN
jgi:dTDP-4-dehydrorhamnose reductase